MVITVDGRLLSMMAFTTTDGIVRPLRAVIGPDRLARLVPSWMR